MKKIFHFSFLDFFFFFVVVVLLVNFQTFTKVAIFLYIQKDTEQTKKDLCYHDYSLNGSQIVCRSLSL